MAKTRWKGMAGVLGLAIGGLAATADSPNSFVPLNSQACHDPKQRVARSPVAGLPLIPPAPSVETIQVAFQPPQVVTPPTPAEAPLVTPVTVQPAVTPVPLPNLTLPPVNTTPELPTPTEVPPTKPATPVVEASRPAGKVVEIPLPLPREEQLATKPVSPVIESPAGLPSGPVRTPAVASPKLEIQALSVDPPAAAITRNEAESKPDLALPVPAQVEAAKPSTASAAPIPGHYESSSAVRVVLRLGIGQPRFEVLSGEDTLLKVVCDKVDVRSSGLAGSKTEAMMTPLKAMGQIRFSSPGCEGTCDELTVSPTNGEVVVSGHVQVRCKRGKGETQIQASEMRFKLGTAPAYSVADPNESIMQTTFTGSK